MLLDFDPTAITPESLKEQMKTALQASGVAVDMREGSYTDPLLSPAAYQIYKLYAYFPTLLAAAVPSPTSGEFLDSFGAMFGMDRTQGAAASVSLTFSGTAGATIPAGTVATSADGLLRYETDTPAVIGEGGTVTVTATADQVGSKYNLGPGEITRLLVTIAGVSGVTNAQATGGADVESDESYFSRIQTYLSTPVASGNVNHYKQWAREIAGVGYASVQPLWAGAGTVKVIVASEAKGPLDDEIVDEVAEHIEAERPIGADVTVISVEDLDINVSATVTLDESTSAEAVTDQMEAAMGELFLGMEVGGGETIRYNRILALLLSLPGVVDCGSLTVNGDTANITLTTDQVPAVGTVTISEG